MVVLTTATVGRVVALAAQAVLIFGAAAPAPGQVTISSVSALGSGCPDRSASFSISPDRDVFTVTFDKFQLYNGPGTQIKDRSKECQVRVDMSYPSGYAFSAVETTYHGFTSLDQDVTARFKTTYSFAGGAAESSTETSVTGSSMTAGDIYTKTEVIPAEARVKAPCGGNTTFVARTNIALSTRKASVEAEFGTLHGEDTPITQQVKWEWEACAE